MDHSLSVLVSKCRHYRGEVLFVHGSMFTYYGVDFGFVEEAKLRRAREIPPALESYRTTKYFGRKFMLIVFTFPSAVGCSLSDWMDGTPPPTLQEIRDVKYKLSSWPAR